MMENWVLYDDKKGRECCVTTCAEPEWGRIEPNMIYNRFDLIHEGASELFQVIYQGHVSYIPCCVKGNTAFLGIWGMHLFMAQLQAIARYIFEHYPRVIVVSSIRTDLMDAPETFQRENDFHIDLTVNPEEIDQRISSKMRYNLRREHRKAEEAYGSFAVEETSVKDEKAATLFEHYFSMKRITHNREYGMTMAEYIHEYYVSSIYTLWFGKHIAAILLSCEQGRSVYLENLTYDVSFAKFSPGSLLYNCYLKRLSAKGKKSLYLKGGTLAYKRHYGSIEQLVTTFRIYRNTDVVGRKTIFKKSREAIRLFRAKLSRL